MVIGRKKPYTEIGIRRVPCCRCGKPSSQQWQICSLGNRWFGVCGKCDIELQKIVLRFMGIENWKYCLIKYKAKLNVLQS